MSIVTFAPLLIAYRSIVTASPICSSVSTSGTPLDGMNIPCPADRLLLKEKDTPTVALVDNISAFLLMLFGATIDAALVTVTFMTLTPIIVSPPTSSNFLCITHCSHLLFADIVLKLAKHCRRWQY